MNKYFENGKRILMKLESLGYEAFFVGGFVRDFLLGIKASDIDITTNALPNEVEQIFENTKATGKRYGTISVFIDNQQFEVTTYRADIKYIDFRHPKRVVFSHLLEEDLRRRDFTINAFAMTCDLKVVDLFSGRKDLQNRIIKAIGDPDIRFSEDALRMLRAFRFVSKLNFDIEMKTLESIAKNIHLLKKISNERVVSELKQIFQYNHYVKAMKLLHQANIKNAFPEFEAAVSLLAGLEDYKLNNLQFFALAFYLYHGEIPSYWRFSNKEADTIIKTINMVSKCKMNGFDSMLVYEYGLEISLLANSVAVILGYENVENNIEKIYKDLPIKKLKDLDYSGDDLVQIMNGEQSQKIGEILKRIEEQVVKGKLENKYETIQKYVIRILENTDER